MNSRQLAARKHRLCPTRTAYFKDHKTVPPETGLVLDRFWFSAWRIVVLLRVIDPRGGKTTPFPHHFCTTRRFRRGAVFPPTGKAANTGASRHPSIGHSAGALLTKPDGVRN
jgi:hypothetical protein